MPSGLQSETDKQLNRRTSLEKFYGKGGCDCKRSAYFQFQDHRVTTFLYEFKYLIHYYILVHPMLVGIIFLCV